MEDTKNNQESYKDIYTNGLVINKRSKHQKRKRVSVYFHLRQSEWKDSIFFGDITYQDLLVQAYLCRVQTKINNSQHSGYRQVYSQWIPDISIYLLPFCLEAP